MQKHDLVIVGGGLIGCASAWRLAQRGLDIAVIERGEIGGEATNAAGGMLAPLSEADRDNAFLQLCRRSLAIYPDFVREIREASGIDVEYREDGTLYLSLTDADDEELDHRWQWQKAAGLDTERLAAKEVLSLEPGLNPRVRWGLRFPGDHQVNNRRLIRALRMAGAAAGATYYTQTGVRDLMVESVGGRRIVTGVATDRGEFRTRAVLLAAGCWSSRFGSLPLPYEVKPIRGQMVSVEMPLTPLRHVIYSRRAYLVPRLSGELIAGSTTETVGYDRRFTAGGIASIVERATEIMPEFGTRAIIETWAGLRPRTTDALPILGPDPEIAGLIHATGHYRNGILLAPLTGQIVVDLVLGDESSIDLKPFSAARFSNHPTTI